MVAIVAIAGTWVALRLDTFCWGLAAEASAAGDIGETWVWRAVAGAGVVGAVLCLWILWAAVRYFRDDDKRGS